MKVKMLFRAVQLIVLITLISCATSAVQKQETVRKQEVPLTYINSPYAKLDSEAFVDDYAGKGVSFKIMFIGEFTLVKAYELGGVDTKGRIFIDHRDSSNSDIGGYGHFALSIEKEKSDFIYESKRGDIFEVKGITEKVGLPGKVGLHILIHDIKKITQP